MSERRFSPEKREAAGYAVEAHYDELSEALHPEAFKYFLQMPPEQLHLVIASEYFEQLPDDPTEMDGNVVDAYIEWLSAQFDVDEIAEEFGVEPKQLKQLIGNIPTYLQDGLTDRRAERLMATRVVGNVIHFDFKQTDNGRENSELATVTELASRELRLF